MLEILQSQTSFVEKIAIQIVKYFIFALSKYCTTDLATFDSTTSSQHCAAALLFGCSSGRLEREGIFGPDAAVLAYLRAGSSAVLAMLWDVTDRDIDQLSVHVLRKWLLREPVDDAAGGSSSDDAIDAAQLPLALALRHARAVCKLPFLNGHAAVCYGLPLFAL